MAASQAEAVVVQVGKKQFRRAAVDTSQQFGVEQSHPTKARREHQAKSVPAAKAKSAAIAPDKEQYVGSKSGADV